MERRAGPPTHDSYQGTFTRGVPGVGVEIDTGGQGSGPHQQPIRNTRCGTNSLAIDGGSEAVHPYTAGGTDNTTQWTLTT